MSDLTLKVLNKVWTEWVANNLIKEGDSEFYVSLINVNQQTTEALANMVSEVSGAQLGQDHVTEMTLTSDLVDMYAKSAIAGIEFSIKEETVAREIKQIEGLVSAIALVIGKEAADVLRTEWLKVSEISVSRKKDLLGKAARGEFLRHIKRGQGTARHLKIIH